jgi:hypothetical protein
MSGGALVVPEVIAFPAATGDFWVRAETTRFDSKLLYCKALDVRHVLLYQAKLNI